jgi:hypothetical protein
MAIREDAIKLVNELSDNQVHKLVSYGRFLKAEASGLLNFNLDIPNTETLEAIKEVEEMQKDPSNYKTYSSFSEILNEALKEIESDV